MVSLTIIKPPNEVIFHIFEFLDKKSLLNASLVNKNWRDLFRSSTAFMNKFKISLNKKDNPEELMLKHINVDIGVHYESFKKTFEEIADTALDTSKTRKLRLTTTKKFDIPTMLKLLSQMEELETFCLDLDACTNDFNESKIKHLALQNLKVLNIT